MDIVATDILSGLPVTDDGLRCILVLTDYFMKWACAFALPDAEASTCMCMMYDGFFGAIWVAKSASHRSGKKV